MVFKVFQFVLTSTMFEILVGSVMTKWNDVTLLEIDERNDKDKEQQYTKKRLLECRQDTKGDDV